MLAKYIAFLLTWKKRFPRVRLPSAPFDALLFQVLKHEHLIIDCGANVGSISRRLLRASPTLIAFEPHPAAFKVLKERIGHLPNVLCLREGVGARDGSFQLFMHRDGGEDDLQGSKSSSLFPTKANVSSGRSVEVRIRRLSSFIASLKRRVRLLKLDVEGAEVEILNDLIDSGTIGLIDAVIAETHEEKIQDLAGPTSDLRCRIRKENIRNVYLDWH